MENNEFVRGDQTGEWAGVSLSDGARRPESSAGGVWYRLARAVSVLMHPFLIPLYILLLMLYGGTMMSFIAERTKLFFIAIVALNTMVVPALFIGLLGNTGYVSGTSLNDRRDRIVPLLVTAVCYGACAFMIPDNYLVLSIRKFLLAGTVCVLAAALITWRWKISLHMTATGAALAILIILNMSWPGEGLMLVPIVATVVLAGCLASARLYLGAHTLAQTGAGFLLGFAVAAAVVLLF